MENILKTTNLTKQYKDVKAVDSINLTLNKGDIYGFIGRNGAGKTTTLKMIAGLAKPTSGSFTLFDIPAYFLKSSATFILPSLSTSHSPALAVNLLTNSEFFLFVTIGSAFNLSHIASHCSFG